MSAHDPAFPSSSATSRPTQDADVTRPADAVSCDDVPPLPRLGSALGGRFRLERVLGTGGTGVVFEAFDFDSMQSVAIKVLRRRDPQALFRLKREFRQLAELCHPNLIGMHELFVDAAGHAFFSMELVEGATSFLRHQRPDGQSWTLERLVRGLRELVRGVQHLHAHGKIHRDLKPSNVLVDRQGRVRIVDFGLVASPHEGPRAGRIEGTPGYAAPEQLAGRAPSPASDWYAVGVMLYEVLRGARPLEPDGSLSTATSLQPAAAGIAPALEHVCLRLLESDPDRRATGRELLELLDGDAAAIHGGRPLQPAPARPALPPFVGRSRELTALERAFESGLTAMIIEGPSGVGKTSLAQHHLSALEGSERATILRGRCFVVESIRYNALDGVIDALAEELTGEPLEHISPSNLRALAQLFPVLRAVRSIARATRPARPETALEPRQVPRAAAMALRAVLESLSRRRPVVLFIDDLQWTDGDSARLLDSLFEPPLRSVFLLATYREPAQGSPAEPELDRLIARSERVELAPLSAEAVFELASRSLQTCPASLARAIARQSHGDPLLATELIRYASAQGELPASEQIALATAFRARVASLSAPGRTLLELVCVAGRRLPRSLFVEGMPEAMTALRELRLGSLVRESRSNDGLHLEPYHERIRAFVVAALEPTRLRQLHGEIAARLREYGAGYLDQVADLYRLAGMPRQAGEFAERAARDAANQFAFHRAAELLELALRCADDPAKRRELRVATGLACARAGRLLAAAAHYEAAAGDAIDRAERAHLRRQAVTAYLASGHSRAGTLLLERSAAELGIAIDYAPMRWIPGLWWMARLLVSGRPKLRAAPEPPSSRDAAALELLWRTVPAVLVVDPERALQFAVRAMILAAERGQASIYGQSLSFQLASFAMVGIPSGPLLERRFKRARELAERSGDIWDVRLVRVMRACAASARMDYERTLAECLAIARSTELGDAFAVSVRNCARGLVMPSLYWLGRLPELAIELERWREEALDSGDRHLQISCLVFGAQLHLRSGDVARARGAIAAAEEVVTDYPHPALLDPWWRVQIELFAGEPERAQAIHERAIARAPSYLQHCPALRMTWIASDAQCAAALAARGIDRDANVARLVRTLRIAERGLGRDASRAIAPLRAMVACALQLPAALPQLRAALRLYRRLGLRLHAASMQLALARLEPRADAAEERAARAIFAAAEIQSPERWAAMIAPGVFPPPPAAERDHRNGG